MRNIKLIVEYDGSRYYGLQKQTNKETVQSEIERAIKEITNEDVTITYSGRTDAGVSAYGQVISFKTNTDIPVDRLPLALNSHLKKSIIVQSAEEASDNFHPRYSCKGKKYMYVINNSRYGSAIFRKNEYHVPQKLDVDSMKKAIKYFEGTHDFKAFKASGTSNKDSVRTIYEANIFAENDRINIQLRGNGFLYNMVRIITGTLIDVGLGKIKPEDIPDIIESKDRKKAGKTVPPHGLYLMEVYY